MSVFGGPQILTLNLVELRAQFLLGFVGKYAKRTPASSFIDNMKNNEVQYE